MRTTMTLATNMNSDPFRIFDQEVEEVIMLINFYIRLNETSNKSNLGSQEQKGKVKRVRVNDKTATNGWF